MQKNILSKSRMRLNYFFQHGFNRLSTGFASDEYFVEYSFLLVLSKSCKPRGFFIKGDKGDRSVRLFGAVVESRKNMIMSAFFAFINLYGMMLSVKCVQSELSLCKKVEK